MADLEYRILGELSKGEAGADLEKISGGGAGKKIFFSKAADL